MRPRLVTANRLCSFAQPGLCLRVDHTLAYVGGPTFVLYNVAQVEQHLFVDVDAQRRVTRLFWAQFEGYLDTNTHIYHYPIKDTLTLASHTFLHDADVHAIDEDLLQRPDSDSAAVARHLQAMGYTFSGDTLFKRFVWLDEAKRNEMMLIYSEDLAPYGYGVADLMPGGRADAHWPALAEALHTRALAMFRIEPI